MKSLTMLQFRRQAEEVLKQVKKGRAFLLTYRGKPVARLEPITDLLDSTDDPIYSLDELASLSAEPLTNAEIDKAVYGA
jgi:prevent-host-death family protein